jgi:hypothetical protein
MNPPHCLTQKCQKLNQLPSSWTPTSKATLDKSHQQQIRAYILSTSPRDFAPLYWWQKKMCWPWNSSLISCLMCLLNNWILWNKHVCSLLIIFIEGSPNP